MNPGEIRNQSLEYAKKFAEDTEKYIDDKRKNWQHLTVIFATILGFSLSINSMLGVRVATFLLISLILQIFTILTGILLLILESESKNYRKIIFFGVQLKILEILKNSASDSKEISSAVKKALDNMYGDKNKTVILLRKILKGEFKKEDLYKWFGKNFSKFESFFYIMMLLSFLFLIINLVIIWIN